MKTMRIHVLSPDSFREERLTVLDLLTQLNRHACRRAAEFVPHIVGDRPDDAETILRFKSIGDPSGQDSSHSTELVFIRDNGVFLSPDYGSSALKTTRFYDNVHAIKLVLLLHLLRCLKEPDTVLNVKASKLSIGDVPMMDFGELPFAKNNQEWVRIRNMANRESSDTAIAALSTQETALLEVAVFLWQQTGKNASENIRRAEWYFNRGDVSRALDCLPTYETVQKSVVTDLASFRRLRTALVAWYRLYRALGQLFSQQKDFERSKYCLYKAYRLAGENWLGLNASELNEIRNEYALAKKGNTQP